VKKIWFWSFSSRFSVSGMQIFNELRSRSHLFSEQEPESKKRDSDRLCCARTCQLGESVLTFLLAMVMHQTKARRRQWRGHPRIFWGANLLTSSEQQYFFWDNPSPSTKWQGMLEIWGAWSPWPSLTTPMNADHNETANVDWNTF